jgi:hypothetical protein
MREPAVRAVIDFGRISTKGEWSPAPQHGHARPVIDLGEKHA